MTTVVLIVDDEHFALHALVKSLACDHYKVMTAKSGEAALKLIRSHLGESIKLLLLDWSLRDMSGLTLAEEAKKLIPDVKILYVSGYAASDKSLESCWITKPFDQKELRARVLRELKIGVSDGN